MNKHASMNRAFRLVWSKARGQYIVASELSRGKSQSSSSARAALRATFSKALAALSAAGMASVAMAQVVPATTVLPTGGNTNAYVSPNGVPVVNINTANGAGVSHNKYTRYDVEANGLVLNNGNMDQSARQSQLAGQVVANINLVKEATLILNEVVSTNRSTLAGFTEVLGGKADVIVANPYGITCSGCGFINTDRVTLTTGVPNFGFDGSVAGFSVRQGDVLINGGGLSATDTQIIDLVARSIRVDGQINGAQTGTLALTTGANTYSYATREVTGSLTASEGAPLYALDSSALGGMYAGRIRIVATEAGLGVRMLGDAAASADDFTLNTAGKVEIRSKISAERDLALTSTAAQADAIHLIDASASAGRNISLTATLGGATFSGGVLVASNDLSFGLGSLFDVASSADIDDNNARFAGNNFTQTVSGAASIDGVSHMAGRALSGQFGSFTVGTDSATLSAGSTLSLTANIGNMTLDTAAVNAEGNLTLNAFAGALHIGSGDGQGVQSKSGDISLSAASGLTNAGIVSAKEGTLTARVNGTLNNSGTLHADTTLDIADKSGNGTQALINTGSLLSDGTMVVKANAVINGNVVRSAAGATMHLGSLVNGSVDNFEAAILGATASAASTITVTGTLDNYGVLHSNDSLSITAGGVTNRDTGGMSSLTALSVSASGASSIANYGALYAGQSLGLTATGGSITNHAGTGTLDSSGTITSSSANFTNNNTIVAAGNITITATTSFKNETLVSGKTISKGWGDIFNTRNWSENQIAEEAAFDYGSNVWVVDEDYSRKEVLIGITEDELSALTKAQILSTGATGTLTINYGGSGLNKIAVLSANTVNISGTGTFTNEDMSLHQYEFKRRWIRVEDESSGDDDFVTWASIDPNRKSWDGNPDSCSGACNWDDWNPGAGWVRSAHVAAGTFPAHLQTWARDRSVEGAIRSGGVVQKRFGAGIFATNLNFTGGTLNNVSSPSPTSTAGAKVDTPRTGSVSPQAPIVAPAFPGLNLSTPSNPNGFFVTPKDPNAKYLVETNPLFNVGSNFVGSDYLAVRLGMNPDTVQKRLGDSNYEAYLIRQQLIEQTGNNVLKGYGDEAGQMQRLMDQGAAQAETLGLTFGKAPTPEQLANLTEDMVWMVETEVNGQKVLAPVVYLAASTRDAIKGGAVIAGTNVNLDVAALNNTGGTISGDNTLNITSKGDITNLSGNIKGGDVNLTSTEGSIRNEAFAQGAGDNSSYATEIGKTAGISATGNLGMDAAKDITVKGADVNATGDVSLAAGNNVTFDTIVDKSAETTYSASSGFLSSSRESTNTITATNIGSSLGAGGNLTIKSGNDTTIAGSNVDVGGNLKSDAAGDFNVVSRQDTKETNTTSSSSGLGVGGGVYGTTETVTNNFQGRNAASTLNVGGNADINTANTMTVQGSDVNIGGNASIKANDVQILAGQDVDRTTSTTTTTTFLKLEGPTGDTHASAGAGAGSGANAMAKGGNASAGAAASAQAGAQAGASGSVGVSLAETSTTNSFNLSQRSVGSNLNIGGNLAIDSKESITIQGSNVDVGGDADLSAKNINVLAAQNIEISSTETTTTKVGLYVDSSNNAGASAGAGASAQANASADARNMSASADASAEASAKVQAGASSDTNIDVMRTTTTKTDNFDLTNTGSVINVGGKLKMKADETLTVQGSEISGEKGVDLQARDMAFLAAQDISTSTTTTTTTSAGLYVSAGTNAEAGASASASASVDQNGAPMASLSAEAGASADAKAGVGVQMRHSTTSSTEGTTTAVTASIRSGSGDVSRTAENRILDQGTQIDAAGNFSQSATTIDSLAAQNTNWSSETTEEHSARLGVYAQANAGAKASLDGGADADASASVGVEMEYAGSKSNAQSRSTEAVVSNIKAGGNVSSTSTGKSTFEGTNIAAGGDVDIAAREVEFKAARNTETSSETSTGGSVALGLGVGLGTEAVDANLSGSMEDSRSNSRSSEAVTGSIASGGNFALRTEKDARFEGTQIDVGGDAKVDVGGNLSFDAARNTSESDSRNIGASLDISASKSGGGGESGSGAGVAAGFSYETEKERSSEAVTGGMRVGGNLDMNAGGNMRFEGTNVEAGGDTSVVAGGNVAFNEARNEYSREASNAGVGVAVGKESSSNAQTGEASSSSSMGLELEGGHSRERASEAVTGSLNSGGNLRVQSGGNTSFVGTEIAAGGAADVVAGGDVSFKAAESTRESFDVGGSLSVGGSSTKTTPGKEAEDQSVKKETEREGSVGFNLGYGTATEHQGGSISAGEGLNISAGNKASFTNTTIKAEDGVQIAAVGGVSNKTVADSNVQLGMRVAVEAKSAEEPKESADKAGAGADAAKADDAKKDAPKTEAEKKAAVKKEEEKKAAEKKAAEEKAAAEKVKAAGAATPAGDKAK